MADAAPDETTRRPARGRRMVPLLVLATVACQGGGPVAGGDTKAAGPDQVMSGVSTTLTTDSSHQTHVVAESAFVYQQAREIHFRRLGVTLFDRQGGQAALVHGERGVYFPDRGVLDLRGKVLLVTLGGDSLSTAHLVYDQRAMQLRTDSAYTFSTRAGVIRGSAFTSDLSMRGITAGRRPDPPR